MKKITFTKTIYPIQLTEFHHLGRIDKITPLNINVLSRREVSTATNKENDTITPTNNRLIKGVRGLAAFLGCGVNKAQQIMNSGVLIEEKIAYKMGHTWLMNREKLTVLLEENPRIFEKISTKS